MFAKLVHLDNGFEIQVTLGGNVLERWFFDKENKEEALDWFRYVQIEVEYDTENQIKPKAVYPCVAHDNEKE